LLLIGRVTTVLFFLIGCWIAPQLANPKFGGVFKYIQEFQGYISPGILAAFVFGFVFKKAPAAAGVTALIVCAPVYGLLHWQFSEIAYLNRMAITFIVTIIIMGVITLARPLATARVMPVQRDYDLRPSKAVLWLGGAVIAAVLAFFIIFW